MIIRVIIRLISFVDLDLLQLLFNFQKLAIDVMVFNCTLKPLLIINHMIRVFYYDVTKGFMTSYLFSTCPTSFKAYKLSSVVNIACKLHSAPSILIAYAVYRIISLMQNKEFTRNIYACGFIIDLDLGLSFLSFPCERKHQGLIVLGVYFLRDIETRFKPIQLGDRLTCSEYRPHTCRCQHAFVYCQTRIFTLSVCMKHFMCFLLVYLPVCTNN